MNKKFLAVTMAIAALALTACSPSSVNSDQTLTNDQLTQYQQAQPVPVFKWSQERATLIAVINARANTTATTSFFFNQGVKDPISTCPSIGYPVASTAELTNPDQVVASSAVVSQIDPPGVYTGVSTGTYVLCVSSSGTKYPYYWEGFVATVGGDAKWDPATGQATLIGEPTVKVPSK